jgi:Rad3-related DNA helicase
MSTTEEQQQQVSNNDHRLLGRVKWFDNRKGFGFVTENNKENIVICLPTGTGKNVIIINSLLKDKKYLILVPRIFLMEQFKEELLKHRPYFKHRIQYIGDNHTEFKDDKHRLCLFVGRENEERAQALLFKIMSEKLREWWD